MKHGYTIDEFIIRLQELREVSMHKGETFVVVREAPNVHTFATAELVPCVMVDNETYLAKDDKNDTQVLLVD
jgi:hypothetical protein